MNEAITLQDVFNAVPVAQKVSNMQLPVKTAYRLSKLLKKIHAEYKAIEEKRMALFKKWGVENADKTYTVPKEKADEFHKEMDELLASPSDIQFQPVTVAMFEGTNLTASDIINLGPFIIEADPAV